MDTFTFVYFDVGGVLIKDFSETTKWQELKADLGITQDQDQAFDLFFGEYETQMCIGLDAQAVVPLIKETFHLHLPDGYLFLKDFVDRFEKNESIWSVVNQAKKKYKVGLLTNMYVGMLTMIKDYGLLPKIDWEVIVDSSIEKTFKPQSAIFEIAEKRAGVPASQILFVENSPTHIQAAQARGWQTFLFDPANPSDSCARLQQLVSP